MMGNRTYLPVMHPTAESANTASVVMKIALCITIVTTPGNPIPRIPGPKSASTRDGKIKAISKRIACIALNRQNRDKL